MDRLEAAVSSAKELRTPLLTSSLTTSAAFLPIFLAESSVGEYTASLFKVVTIALLTSWVLSLTMMPMLCMIFIRVKEDATAESFDSRFYQLYRQVLVLGLRFRWVTIAVVAGTFALAMWGMGFVPAVFMPSADNPRMTGELDLPAGTSIERTAEVAEAVDAYIAENLVVSEDSEEEGITSWATFIGSAGGPRYRIAYDTSSAETGTINVLCTATSRKRIDEMIPELTDWCFNTFPSLTINWSPEEMGPPVANPIAVRIMADDIPTAFACAEELRAWLREYPGTRDIQDDWGPRTKKLVVKVNEARARRAGLSSQDVAVSLQTGFSGIETTQYREGDDIIPIVLRSVAADRRNLSKLDGLNVYAMSTGTSVPLKQIADIEVVWEPSTIYRRDRQKVVEISAGLDPGLNAMAATGDLIPALETMAAGWPGGTSYELGGEWESSQEGNASIGAKLPIAFVIIFVLLMTQFNSFRRLTIVLLTIPLGLIGVTIGLLLAKSMFGFMTLLGVISLAGIIINNAIVLLDRIRIEIDENGLAPADAVIQSAQQRLRPILLTTATTVGGLIPLWVSGGPMWEPMAIAIIFGLLFATVLTLGVVPVLYSFFFRVSFKGYTYGA
jgi:multidrug efflux pump subunit AcrB